jgi:hypothetical protein
VHVIAADDALVGHDVLITAVEFVHDAAGRAGREALASADPEAASWVNLIHSLGPANQCAFCTGSAQAANTRAGEAA